MGVRHVVDALRTVPGLQVAKISSNKWMVASRGFGEQFSNKLLVLINGRPAYTTLFSGVLWDAEDIPIIDVKQIEVIRGPGAALWGSNAVNGVINVITKSTRETLGNQIIASTGFTDHRENQTVIEMQHGREAPQWGGAVRASMKLSKDPSNSSLNDTPGFNNEWQAGQASFRYDKTPSSFEALSIEDGLHISDSEQNYKLPKLTFPYVSRKRDSEKSQSANVQATWAQSDVDNNQLTLRSYLSYTDLEYAQFKPQFFNAGVEGQYDFIFPNNWKSIVGGGYSFYADQIENSPHLFYEPKDSTAHFFDTFFQTKIPLAEDLHITLGSKLESNTYDLFALSPNARLAWIPSDFLMLWTSYSRAYRSPSRGTRNQTILTTGTPGGYTGLVPDENFKSEKLDAYEAGVRINPLRGLQLDTSVFYNDYDRLRTFVAGPPIGSIAFPRYIGNGGAAQNRGIELSATYQTSPKLYLTGSFTHHDLNFKLDSGVTDNVFANDVKRWPRNMWNARVSYQISDDITYNLSSYYTGSMPANEVDGYSKIDTNIAWAIVDNAEIIFGVDNLTDSLHQEHAPALFGEAEEVPRIFYATFRSSL